MQRAMGEHISHYRDRSCGLPRSSPAASCFASIVPSMLPLPCLARRASPRLAASGCAGASPLCCAFYRTPRNPSARPPRPAALACVVYVCVCGEMCNVPVPVNVFLALGLAVACYTAASAFYCFGRCFACVLGFGFGCSCVLLLAQPPSYALGCVLPRSLYSLHTRHTHTSHTTQTTHSPRTLHTPHIHHTPHPPHQHLSPHSTQSCAYASLRWHTTRCMPWGCTLCLLIKSDQIHPKL